MAERKLSDQELNEQGTEQLPDRQAMSVLEPQVLDSALGTGGDTASTSADAASQAQYGGDSASTSADTASQAQYGDTSASANADLSARVSE